MIRCLRKKTNRYYPNGKFIKIGDLISIEDDFQSIDMFGRVEKRGSEYVLNAGHKYYVLPDNDYLANLERVRELLWRG